MLSRFRQTISTVVIAAVFAIGAAANTHAATPSPSGQSIPTASPAGWRTVFTDDFTTPYALGKFPTVPTAKWGAYVGLDSIKHGTYSPTRVLSVHDGFLNVNLHTEAGKPLVGAVKPHVATPQTYGRYAIRWRASKAAGYKQVFLLWPDSGVRAEGEIDFPERNLDSVNLAGFLHRKNAVASQGWAFQATDASLWHTTVIEWKPNLVEFFLDGVKVYSSTVGVPNTPMHLVLQNETQMNAGAPMPAASTVANVQVDWVQISALA